MASAAKTSALTLLTLGLVLGGLGSFLPAGENWSREGGIRDAETFTLFTYTFTRTSGDALVREDVRGWSDDRVADEAGSKAMLSSGIVAVAALLTTIVGTILAFVPRTSRAGGVVSVLGALGIATATALAVLGMRARTQETLGAADLVDPRAGVFLLAGSFLLVLLGGAVAASLRRATGSDATDPWEAYPAHVEARNAARAQAEANARSLRCPDCGTTARVPAGVVPTCASCGFHRRDQPASVYVGVPDAVWS